MLWMKMAVITSRIKYSEPCYLICSIDPLRKIMEYTGRNISIVNLEWPYCRKAASYKMNSIQHLVAEEKGSQAGSPSSYLMSFISRQTGCLQFPMSSHMRLIFHIPSQGPPVALPAMRCYVISVMSINTRLPAGLTYALNCFQKVLLPKEKK